MERKRSTMTSGWIPNENRASSRASGGSPAIALVGRLLNRRPDCSKRYVVTTEGESEARRAWPIEARLGPSRKLPLLGISQKSAVLQRPPEVHDSPFTFRLPICHRVGHQQWRETE
jgi:hypothetical protein